MGRIGECALRSDLTPTDPKHIAFRQTFGTGNPSALSFRPLASAECLGQKLRGSWCCRQPTALVGRLASAPLFHQRGGAHADFF